MTRILHVGVGNLDSGGVATYVRAVSEGQRSRGHEVVVAELWSNGASMREVEHHLGGLESLRALQDRIRPDATHLHSQLPDYEALRGPSVLTAHEHSAHCPSGGRYLHARRRVCERRFGLLPCLWGHYVDRCGSRNPSTFRHRFSVTSRSDRFGGEWIAPSSFTATWLERRGLDPRRIHTIGNPLPGTIREETNPAPEAIVLFLGRLVPNKGCDVLLRALALLPPAVGVWIAGEGPERASLEDLSRRLGLESRADFLGWTSSEQVRERLDRCRVLAVPSLWPEPFGLVALEAYSAGRPVVASSVGGLTDLVVDGRTGSLVPPNDPIRLAQALSIFLADLPMALRAGREGAVFAAERHGMASHLDALDRVYALAQERAS